MITIKVYLETGKKRTIAGAVDWPGWCRIRPDEPSALQALVDYGPRYTQVLRPAGIEFQAPADRSAFAVIERLVGNASTDYGVPAIMPEADREAVDPAAHARYARAAAGLLAGIRPRRTGCSGENITQRAARRRERYRADPAACSRRRAGLPGPPGLETEKRRIKKRGRTGHGNSAPRHATGGSKRTGSLGQGRAAQARPPRGGDLAGRRYYVRRAAWHILDHAWEIEDRVE